MAIAWNRLSRKLHRWGAMIIFVPLLLVIATGLLLQVKKQFSWIQPTTQTGSTQFPQIGWDQILSTTASVPAAEVESWSDIERLDVRPARGLVKIRCKNRWEVQVDLNDGKLLSSSYRRSDLIESLHDGSYFSDAVKLWIFLPTGIILLGLWLTGAYLWWLPFGVKRKKASRQKQNPNAS